MNRIVLCSVVLSLAAIAFAQTPALRKGVSVQMPVTTSAATLPDADMADSVVVAVTAHGVVYLNVTTVTPKQLSRQVKEEIGAHPGKRIYVKADARTPYSAVAEALSALRTAGVTAPYLLTSQHEPSPTTYVPPSGLEVLLPPPAPGAAQSVTLRIGNGRLADAEMRQQAQRGLPVVLQVDEQAPFGDVAHAIDICRAAGARVYLSASAK